jgi:hypothetical protein
MTSSWPVRLHGESRESWRGGSYEQDRGRDHHELTVIVAPVVLGGGKRLFDGFDQSLDLEHVWVRQSPYATFLHYRVKRPGDGQG